MKPEKRCLEKYKERQHEKTNRLKAGYNGKNDWWKQGFRQRTFQAEFVGGR